MKRAIQATIFGVLSAALGIAHAQQVHGNWSVYESSTDISAHETLIQTQSLGDKNSAGQDQASAKLSVVCRKGKLSGIAMTMDYPISDAASNINGDYQTTQVSYYASGKSVAKTSWLVLDGGQTLTPYSEAFESKVNHQTLDTLTAQRQLSLEIPRRGHAGPVKVMFDTNGLAEALASVGCR